MLRNTFRHIPGIGPTKEHRFWEAGVLTWDDYVQRFPSQSGLFDDTHADRTDSAIEESFAALERGDMDYFAERLPPSEHYRIALTVPADSVFLDIETTGLSPYYDEITLIGLSRGDTYFCYIKGTDKKALYRELERAKCLITFNGKAFDLKFIEKEHPQAHIPKAHVDLRFFARAFGYSGPQKTIESQIGVKRPADINDVIGEKAPLLWHDYRMGKLAAARQLIEYNHADVEGMKAIFDATLRKITQKVPLLPTQVNGTFSAHSSGLRFAKQKSSVKKNQIFVPPYRGKRGPLITFDRLAPRGWLKDLRVVGIDLTGSERRPTGWCFLNGRQAHTKLISSDPEILVETLNVSPHVVSIDSPLSLPAGRTKATDDDPMRDSAGIMRECERLLKRRGVNVYPALIPSMQKLTARGIRLASQFRQLGIPVIESYPGAAQDIMGIPRKRVGLEHLVKGLADFGVTGAFEKQRLSHDELDAITSAIVGVFFWSGRFEPIGNEEEDYLIIPDLRRVATTWRTRKVIGISGPIAAGKTTAARHLEIRKFAYSRYSLVLSKMLKESGIEADRSSLQKLGEEVHEGLGQRWLSKQLVSQMPAEGDLVIDGLRFPEDHAHMVETYGPAFRHLHVGAPANIRRSRYRALGNLVREFEGASLHPVEAKVRLLANLAHIVLENGGSIEAFRRRITQAIRSSGNRGR